MPALKPETSEARRAAIFEAAMRCFARKGYKGTTIRDISSEAGISLGALYTHFANKDDLLTNLAQRLGEERQLDFAQSQDQSPVEQIEGILTTLSNTYDTETGRLERIADLVMLGEAHSIPALREVLAIADRQYFEEFEKLLTRSEMPLPTSPKNLSRIITGAFFGLIILSEYHEDFDIAEYIKTLRILLDAASSNGNPSASSERENDDQ